MIVTPSWIGCRKLRMCYPFLTPGGVISRRDEQSNRVYMTSEWVFVKEWKSRYSTVTGGVNSYRKSQKKPGCLVVCRIPAPHPSSECSQKLRTKPTEFSLARPAASLTLLIKFSSPCSFSFLFFFLPFRLFFLLFSFLFFLSFKFLYFHILTYNINATNRD